MSAETKNKNLDFTIQHQQKEMWCWSAVGASCALFYKPDSGWTQCKLVSASLQPSPGKCCRKKIPKACLQTWYLEDLTETRGSFITTGIANGFVKGPVAFDRLKEEIDKGRIVAYRLHLTVKMGGKQLTVFHFVVVAGYDDSTGQPTVHIYDSFFGNSSMPYDEFTAHYKNDGFVTHSFFTQPQKQT